MPSRTAKRKGRAEASGDDDEWTAPKRQSQRKRRAHEPNIDQVTNTEQEGDVATRHFQSWAVWQKTFVEKERQDRSHFADVFKQNIENKRQRIENLLGVSNEAFKEANRKSFASAQDVCANSKDIGGPSTTQDKALNFLKNQPLFKAGQEVLQTCRELVTIHEEANGRTLIQPDLQLEEMRATWNEDVAQVEKILLYGSQYGEKIVKLNVSLLPDLEDRARLLLPPQNGLDEAGEIAWEMHRKSTDMLMKDSSTWGEESLTLVGKLLDIINATDRQAGGF